MPERFDILCAGNYTKDTIITPTETRVVDGGAVNYAASAALRLGRSVAVITHLAEEDRRVVDGLTAAGARCFPRFTEHSTRITLSYPTPDPDTRAITVTHTADPIAAKELEQVSARWIIFGSTLRGEVGLEAIWRAKATGARVGLDVQGFARVLRGGALRYEDWEEMPAALAHVDVLKSDAVEAEHLTGLRDLHDAARAFAALGPSEVVLTHRDGLLVYAEGAFYHLRFLPRVMLGRSGRGDTCLGAYAAARIDQEPGSAALTAAAVTSLKMEKPAPYDRSPSELEEFIRKYYGPPRCE